MTRDFEYVCAAFLTRLFVGVIFLVAGVSKVIGGYMGFVDTLTSMFAGTWLPQVVVSPVAYALPAVEILLGIVLLIGVWSDKFLLVSGLIFILSAAGSMILGKGEIVAYNAVYLLVTTLALYLHGYDDWRLGQ